MNNDSLVHLTETSSLMDTQALQAWEEFMSKLRSDAKDRRRKKTPKGIRKQREGGSGKVFTYVDRAEYQRWLDETFPGWSIKEVRFWSDKASKGQDEYPILFNCMVTLVLPESGILRTIAGVGSESVSIKEVLRDNTQLLSKKYNIALTDAIKTACGWAGAFFDLRADEEEREKALAPPDSTQENKFNALFIKVPPNVKDILQARWKLQTRMTADKFLSDLEDKVKALEAAAEVNAQPTEPQTPTPQTA